MSESIPPDVGDSTSDAAPESNSPPSWAVRADPDKREAILGAAFALLGEVGYDKLRVQTVAERAGVSKTTVYRWWPTKPALVMEAFVVRAARDVPVPDTGNLREDLRLVLGHLIFALTRLGSGRVMAGLIAASQDDIQLAGAFRDRFLAQRREVLRTVLARARERGELGGNDPEFLIDMMYGVVYYRLLLTHEPLDGPLATAIIDNVLTLTRTVEPGPR